MPKTTKMSEVMTRIPQDLLVRIRILIHQYGITMSQFAREALAERVDRYERRPVDQFEGIYAKSLSGHTNRTCGLLAKVGFDASSTYIYLSRLDPEAMRECRALAVKRLAKTLGPLEKEIALGLEQQITNRSS